MYSCSTLHRAGSRREEAAHQWTVNDVTAGERLQAATYSQPAHVASPLRTDHRPPRVQGAPRRLARSPSMGQTLNRSIVVWADEGPRCSFCHEPFTMFRARHHCRSCGLLTCDDCSPYTAFLPQLGWGNEQPQRVCRLCSGKSLAVVEVEMDAYVLCSRTDANRADIAQLEQLASAVRTAKSYPTFNVFLFRLLVATLTSVFSQVHHRMQETLHWVTTSSHVDSAALRDCISNADRLRAIHARTGAYVGKIDLAPLEKHAQRVKGKLAHRLAPVRIRASTMRPPCIRPQRSLKNTAPKHVRFSIAKPPPSPIELDLRDARTCSTTLLRSEPPLRVVTH